MTLHDLFLILHLLLFCYWLGGDIGVFYSSGFAADPGLSIESRQIAAKIMLGLDIVPRACGALMLTVGGVLSEFIGIEHPPWLMVAIILLAPAWLALELILHFRYDSPLGRRLQKLDNPFKWAVIVGCVVSATFALADGRLAQAPWVGYKVLVFAAIVFCSLMINKTIGPYIIGIQKIAEGKIQAAETAAMAASLRQVKWAVIGIWMGLVIAAAIGVVRPGT